MNKQALLEQLKDIHTPDSVSWWPLAPIWWVLIGLIVIALLFFGWRRWCHYQAMAPLRQAFNELAALDPAASDFLPQLHRLQRRVALVSRSAQATNQQQVAALTGSAWNQFLNQNGQHFSTEQLATLQRHLYRQNASIDSETHSALKSATYNWLSSLRHDFKPKVSRHA